MSASIFTELINLEKAEKLLCNWEQLCDAFDKADREDGRTEPDQKYRDGQYTILKKVIIKTKSNGSVSYRPGSGKTYGRLYADGASVQQLMRCIRNTICEDLYDDIDMSKCAPTILLWKAEKYNIKMKNLTTFVKTDTYKHLKKNVNSILFGGNIPEDKSLKDKKYLNDLKTQMFVLYDKLLKDPEYTEMLDNIKKNHKWNVEGKLAAQVFQKIEAEILAEAFDYLVKSGLHVNNNVKMYDGFQHPKGVMTPVWIEYINNHIFATLKIPVKFVMKPFSDIIDTANMSNATILEQYTGRDNYLAEKYLFEKSYAKIISDSVFLKTDTLGFKSFNEKNLVVSYKHLSYKTEKMVKGEAKGWTNKQFLGEWLLDPDMRTYNSMGVYPPPLICPERDYNLWLPFLAESSPELGGDDDAVEFFKNHIAVLCNHDETITTLILNWLGQMLQYPSHKTFVPTFISKQGAGKGRLIDLMKKIIGHERVLDTSKPSQYLFGDFNGCMVNAFLVCLNEMSKKEMQHADGYFKTLATDPTIQINKKHVESFTFTSYHRYIVFSNNEDPIMTSDDDRRNVIIRCSDELCDKTINEAYWTKMSQIIDCPNAIKSIYNYLMSIPDLDTFHQKKTPKTDYHKDVIEANEPIQAQFIKWLITNDQFKDSGVVELKAEEIMTHFRCFKNAMDIKEYDVKAPKLLLWIKNLNITGFDKRPTKSFNLSVLDMPKMRDHFKVATPQFVADADSSESEVETD